jgi:hypothetical protein
MVAAGTLGGPPRPDFVWMRVVGASRLITGDELGSGSRAGWESEAAVVPLELSGQHNPRRGKGRCFVYASRTGKG